MSDNFIPTTFVPTTAQPTYMSTDPLFYIASVSYFNRMVILAAIIFFGFCTIVGLLCSAFFFYSHRHQWESFSKSRQPHASNSSFNFGGDDYSDADKDSDGEGPAAAAINNIGIGTGSPRMSNPSSSGRFWTSRPEEANNSGNWMDSLFRKSKNNNNNVDDDDATPPMDDRDRDHGKYNEADIENTGSNLDGGRSQRLHMHELYNKSSNNNNNNNNNTSNKYYNSPLRRSNSGSNLLNAYPNIAGGGVGGLNYSRDRLEGGPIVNDHSYGPNGVVGGNINGNGNGNSNLNGNAVVGVALASPNRLKLAGHKVMKLNNTFANNNKSAKGIGRIL